MQYLILVLWQLPTLLNEEKQGATTGIIPLYTWWDSALCNALLFQFVRDRYLCFHFCKYVEEIYKIILAKYSTLTLKIYMDNSCKRFILHIWHYIILGRVTYLWTLMSVCWLVCWSVVWLDGWSVRRSFNIFKKGVKLQ